LEGGELYRVKNPKEIQKYLNTAFKNLKRSKKSIQGDKARLQAAIDITKFSGEPFNLDKDIVLNEQDGPRWENVHPGSMHFSNYLLALVPFFQGGEDLDDADLSPSLIGDYQMSDARRDLVNTTTTEFELDSRRFFRIKLGEDNVERLQEVQGEALFDTIFYRLGYRSRTSTIPMIDISSFPMDSLHEPYTDIQTLLDFGGLQLRYPCREEVFNLKKFIQNNQGQTVTQLCTAFAATDHTSRNSETLKSFFFRKDFINAATGQKAYRYTRPLATWPTIEMLRGCHPIFGYSRHWSEREDNLLLRLYGTLAKSSGSIFPIISFFMGTRTPWAVYNRLKELGIRKNGVILSGSV
jgi:hypothetical protein